MGLGCGFVGLFFLRMSDVDFFLGSISLRSGICAFIIWGFYG